MKVIQGENKDNIDKLASDSMEEISEVKVHIHDPLAKIFDLFRGLGGFLAYNGKII